MGAWGAGSFQNDAALDWYEEFRSAGTAAVDDAFSAAEIADYVDVDEGCAALAAAEIVAAAFGKPLSEQPADFSDLLARYQDFVKELPDVRARAISAVKRAVAESSELSELWSEGGDGAAKEWMDLVNDLLSRLETAD